MRGNREVKFLQALKSAAQAAGAVNGETIDALGYGVVEFLLNVGTPGSSGTIDAKIQNADVTALGAADTFADLASGGSITQVTATGLVLIRIDTRAVKRFLRIVVTTAVATSPVSAIACLRQGAGQPEAAADLLIGFA